MAPKTVESFLESNGQWRKENTDHSARDLACNTGMEESHQMGYSCLLLQRKKCARISAFKSYAGLWFYQGHYSRTKKKVLMNAQEGKTKPCGSGAGPGEKIPNQQCCDICREAMKLVDDGKEIKPEKTKPWKFY